MNATTRPPADEGQEPYPPDLRTMRMLALRLLAEDAPAVVDLNSHVRAVRGAIAVLAPAVATAAKKLPKDDVPRYCAAACVSEAGMQLRCEPEESGRMAHARKLSRSLNALCDHYEALSGGDQS